MATRPEEWYGCIACGEQRRFPFDTNADRPGCRCRPAEGASEGRRDDDSEIPAPGPGDPREVLVRE